MLVAMPGWELASTNAPTNYYEQSAGLHNA